MKKAKFWVDYCLEAGGENVCHRYWFEIEMTDEDFEELYQFWYDNNCELKSWYLEWKGHEKMFDKLEGAAIHALNDLLKEHEPEFVNPVDVYWEIAKETEDAF